MLTDLDIYRSAKILVEQHGADAKHEATRRADALRDKGDLDGQAAWMRILGAVKELLQARPDEGDVVH